MFRSKGQIAVIALGMSRLTQNLYDNPEYKAYSAQTAHEKMDLIKKTIVTVCEQLQKKEPHAMWIVAWQEYGITDPKNRSVSLEFKREFIKEMQLLCEKYPNLAILAGTMATRREITRDKLTAIERVYASEHYAKWLRLEAADGDFIPHFKDHKHVVQKMLDLTPSGPIYMLRNTAYFITASQVLRHDKLLPYEETAGNPDFPNMVYQPAKEGNRHPILNVRHTVTSEPVALGIEICRENSYGLLQDVTRENKPVTSPEIHFILSEGLKPNVGHAYGKQLIHLDAVRSPKLIQVDSHLPTVKFYQQNLFTADEPLQGPLQPIVPFQKRVLKMVDRALKKISLTRESREILQIMREDINSGIAGTFADAGVLDEQIQEYLSQLESLEKTSTTTPRSCLPLLSFFGSGANTMQTWIHQVRSMLELEKQEHPIYVDIYSYKNRPAIVKNKPSGITNDASFGSIELRSSKKSMS